MKIKCLVTSDTHSSGENIGRAIAKCPDAEVIFFLGDGIAALDAYVDRYPDKAWLFVLGNCDRPTFLKGSFVGKTARISLCGKRIVLTHGDLYGAKYGTEGLFRLAAEERADIVLFGHTHKRKEYYDSERGVWLFNPGSLEHSWDESPSFGLMTLGENGDVLFSHGSL